MLATAKNYDVICMQMRFYLPQQEDSVQKETQLFLNSVKNILISGQTIKPLLNKFIPQIFNFRMLALKWISQQEDIDIPHLLDKVYPSIERLKSNQRLTILAENILFAMRCNEKVVKTVMGDDETVIVEISKYFASAPATTYEQFFGTLAMTIPDDAAFQIFVDFAHQTLFIEFILLAAVLINEDSLTVSTETIDELAFLIADAAQEYFAIATQLGIIPSRNKMMPVQNVADCVDFKEDQLLSNLGLSDFALNF